MIGAVKAHELRTFGKGELTAQLAELRTELQTVSSIKKNRFVDSHEGATVFERSIFPQRECFANAGQGVFFSRSELSTRRSNRRSPFDDPDLSRKMCMVLAHVSD